MSMAPQQTSSQFSAVVRSGSIRKQRDSLEKELSKIASVSNPISAGTVDATAIVPGNKIVVLGFGDQPSLRTVEIAGYTRRLHDEAIYVDTTDGSINIVEAGISPDINEIYVTDSVAFPDTPEGRRRAEDFLYEMERLIDEDGQPVYPGAAKTVELFVKYARNQEMAEGFDHCYPEENLRTSFRPLP